MKDLLDRNLALPWIKNGLIALGFAGLYSIIIVALRTPQLRDIIGNAVIFKSALVIHVNLSVLVWLISIVCAVWALVISSSFFNNICRIFALIGEILMIISPIFGGKPIMNNYIPILENIVFIIGISLFSITTLIFAIFTIVDSYKLWLGDNAERFLKLVAFSSALIFVMVWSSLCLSYFQLQKIINLIPIDIEFYYELLFWGGGHLLQCLYTQILMFVWIVIFDSSITSKSHGMYIRIFWLNFVLAMMALPGHFYYIMDAEFKEYFTAHMKYSVGIAPILIIMLSFKAVVINLFQRDKWRIPASIICSYLLYLSGGAIALLISGVNLVIPAHYHGSIVAVTIAFMGFVYLLAFKDEHKPWHCRQIYVLTLGQILHISGLAIAGGYGVMRKTYGEELLLSAKIAMGVMGIGGLVAIIGGLMFVYICGKRLFFYR